MKKNGYFHGWYFKCCGLDKTVAFIPAYHRSKNVTTASLQVITDDNAYNIPFDNLHYTEKPLSVRIGECTFSDNGISLNYKSEQLCLKGKLEFGTLSPIAYDIMGPFALVPFMQCRHKVFSMRHKIEGHITVNDRLFQFNNGIGYIEGDRGYSFPTKYIWTQCCFENGALMLSVADIPMLGFNFTGIIGVVLISGREYRIATYLGARITRITEDSVTVNQDEYQLTARLLNKNAHPLFAPVNGTMSRTIHESAACKAQYSFLHKDNVLLCVISEKAGFEFEYPLK